MYRNLLGEVFLDINDYAIMVFDYFSKFLQTYPLVFDQTSKGIFTESSIKIPDDKGLVMFCYLDTKPVPLFLCHGKISDRIYRFGKEILGRSRKDEGFPLAKKLRLEGCDPNSLGFRYQTFEELVLLNRLPSNPLTDHELEKLKNIINERIHLVTSLQA